MLNKILQNKIIAGTVIALLLIIGVIVFVLVRSDSQEHKRSDLDVQSENATEEVDAPVSWDGNNENSMTDETDTTDQKDSSSSIVNQDREPQNTGMEILEDDSKTQTESVDAPVSWGENHENSITDRTDTTGKTDTTNTTDETDSNSPSTDKDNDTNMPIEKVPDDEDVAYGSIF